jgi:tRNA U34 5-methylaminomethyl-2-thiouridine-forming methyltransferase MnmC
MNDGSDALILTGDGSYTLHSAEYDENMHTISGAYEEAILKHVMPSGVLMNKSGNIAVLDVGFGIGYNTLALLTELSRMNYRGSISIVSFEKERAFLPFMDSIHFNDERDIIYAYIKKAYHDGSIHTANVSITILFGDARVSVRTLHNPVFDAVFFDPYSPSRNPELWTVDFFMELYRIMTGHGILTTYSSAPHIRTALIAAGFIIGKGPSVGAKREGTLAAKTDLITPLTAEDLSALEQNVRSVPYRDSTLSAGRYEILQNRLKEIKAARGNTS